MKIILTVEASPWGSTTASAALRFAHAVLNGGGQLPLVYFRGDGIYHALAGSFCDAGAQPLTAAWAGLARAHGVCLWCCSAAIQRRLPEAVTAMLDPAFEIAGMGRFVDAMAEADRVVGF